MGSKKKEKRKEKKKREKEKEPCFFETRQNPSLGV
jgi:hypothetical protein